MTSNLRRFGIVFFAVLCIVLPAAAPAHAANPYFYNVTFVQPGTCSNTYLSFFYSDSFHYPDGTLHVVTTVNGVPFPPWEIHSTEVVGGTSGTTIFPIPSTNRPYTFTEETWIFTNSGELVIHGFYSFNCDAAGVATGSYTNLPLDSEPLFTDGRINPDAIATVVGYCDDNGGIEAYLPNGKQIFKVTAEQIENALKQAADSHKNVLIKQASGQQLWALASGELQLQDALGSGYQAIFAGNRCGE